MKNLTILGDQHAGGCLGNQPGGSIFGTQPGGNIGDQDAGT